MRIRAILSYLCVASLAGGLAFAAAPGQIRVQVNLVNLFATVRDKHKAIVTGLKQDDFQVYEDGQLQEITNFSAESNLPITLGILIDTSGSEYYMLSARERSGLALPRPGVAQGRPGHGHDASIPTSTCSPISPMTGRAESRHQPRADQRPCAAESSRRARFPPAAPAARISMTPSISPPTTNCPMKPAEKPSSS